MHLMQSFKFVSEHHNAIKKVLHLNSFEIKHLVVLFIAVVALLLSLTVSQQFAHTQLWLYHCANK